jgi:hypothetical protein
MIYSCYISHPQLLSSQEGFCTREHIHSSLPSFFSYALSHSVGIYYLWYHTVQARPLSSISSQPADRWEYIYLIIYIVIVHSYMKIQCYGRKKRRKVTLVILYILKCLYSVFFIRNSLFCILSSIFSNLYSVFCSCIGGGVEYVPGFYLPYLLTTSPPPPSGPNILYPFFHSMCLLHKGDPRLFSSCL